jgi:hypothetical protein
MRTLQIGAAEDAEYALPQFDVKARCHRQSNVARNACDHEYCEFSTDLFVGDKPLGIVRHQSCALDASVLCVPAYRTAECYSREISREDRERGCERFPEVQIHITNMDIMLCPFIRRCEPDGNGYLVILRAPRAFEFAQNEGHAHTPKLDTKVSC